MASKYYNGVLKDHNKKETSYIHPQTNSRQVLTGENNDGNLQQDLNTINDKFAQIEANNKQKGVFKTYALLVGTYPNGISKPSERIGWTAIVQDEDTQYFYDTTENMWKPLKGIPEEAGIISVQGKTDKNIVLTGSDIDATIDGTNTKTITQHLQDIKNITSDIKQTTINGKSLSDDVELKATDIITASGYSIQSHLSDLELKYNDQEDAIEELENELEPLKNQTDVLYLNNDQMFEALNGIIEPYNNEQVVVCIDDGDYKKGSVYKFNISGDEANPIFEWEEITSSGGTEITDTLTLSKEVVVPELNGTMTYENISTTYGFYIDESDYFINNNQTNNYTNAVVKISFNLSRSTDLFFNFEQSFGTNSFAIFSKVDETYLDNADQEIFKTKFNLSGQTNGELVYKNFPAGEHFITVKFIKNYDSENRYIKFKLTSNLYEPEYTYTSKNTINIGNLNNLQIDGNDILKVGDINYLVHRIEGTSENPINLYLLSDGLYLLNGKFVYNSSSTSLYQMDKEHLFIISTNVGGKTKNIYALNVDLFLNRINVESDNTISVMTLYEATYSGKSYNLNSMATRYGSDSSNSNATLTINNTTAYNPTGEYNPSTKGYVDTSIKSIKHINFVEDINSINVSNNTGKFLSSDLENIKDLYFVKQEITSKVNVTTDGKYKEFNLDETIADVRMSAGMTTRYVDFNVYDENDVLLTSDSLVIKGKTTSGQAYVYNIYISSSSTSAPNKYLLQNDVWNYTKLLPSYFNSNGSYFKFTSIATTPYADFSDYIYSYENVKDAELIRIALYEDLANAGGGIDEETLNQYLPKVIKLG